MTFFEVYDLWLEEHKPEVKVTTFAAYKYVRKTFARVIDEDADICTLDEAKMREVFERFLEFGMSNNYRSDMLMVFRMVMRYASRNLGIQNIPSIDWRVKNIVKRSCNTTRQRVKRFTIDEYERIVKTFENNPSPSGLAVIVTMFTGMRIGEVCGLKFADIDFDEGVIHIQRTCVNITKAVQKMYHPDEEIKTSCRLQVPKSVASDRYIPIVPKLRKILQNYARIYPAEYFLATLADKPTSTRTLREWYKDLLKKANVPYLNYHTASHYKIFYG